MFTFRDTGCDFISEQTAAAADLSSPQLDPPDAVHGLAKLANSYHQHLHHDRPESSSGQQQQQQPYVNHHHSEALVQSYRLEAVEEGGGEVLSNGALQLDGSQVDRIGGGVLSRGMAAAAGGGGGQSHEVSALARVVQSALSISALDSRAGVDVALFFLLTLKCQF